MKSRNSSIPNNHQPLIVMNPEKKVVAFASSHLSISAPTIEALEDRGFDVRHCRNAVATIELFNTSVADQRPTLLISDTVLYNPKFDLLEVRAVRAPIEDNPGVVLFKYLRAYHKNLQAILYTHDLLEKERLESMLEERVRLQIILASAHLTQDIIRAATKEFSPAKEIKETHVRNPKESGFLARKANERKKMILAASH